MPATLSILTDSPSVAGAAARDVTALFPHNKTWRRAANQRALGYNGRPIGRRLPPQRPTIVLITIASTTTGVGLQYRHVQLVHPSTTTNQRTLASFPQHTHTTKTRPSWNFVIANWQRGWVGWFVGVSKGPVF
ncbi:hypothetical protein Pcinc_042335 [Petrolisthes cinctipes]|uniref:Uncharacterized protein n=1 Tax=Petrolisthes cinctipes TaxID=88211 RepID=A0AAE1BI25_PETCI|nr:hypothetical protein Pcinc_042335 [Petrolisthes cinctipes]